MEKMNELLFLHYPHLSVFGTASQDLREVETIPCRLKGIVYSGNEASMVLGVVW